MTTETTVTETVSTESPSTETAPVVAAAEAAVITAGAAVALAEGQAALAEIEAATVIAENAETVRTIEERVSCLENELNDCRRMISELTTAASTPPLPPTMEAETVILAEPGATVAVIEPSTLTGTSGETVLTPMEPSAASERAESEAPIERVRRKRWI